MNIEELEINYPNIEVEAIFSYFPRMPLSSYPELKDYFWQESHDGFMGAVGLFLVSEVANQMEFKVGMRLLDLCCGDCASSIFLAKHYDANVVARAFFKNGIG